MQKTFTYEYDTPNFLKNKISAIKLIREFTQHAFGVSADLNSSKALIDAVVLKVENEIEKKKMQETVIAMLLATPMFKRRHLLAYLGTYAFEGRPNFNRFDTVYGEYLP